MQEDELVELYLQVRLPWSSSADLVQGGSCPLPSDHQELERGDILAKSLDRGSTLVHSLLTRWLAEQPSRLSVGGEGQVLEPTHLRELLKHVLGDSRTCHVKCTHLSEAGHVI